VVPPEAVRVAEDPAQIIPSLLAIPDMSVSVIVIIGFVVTVTADVPVQPLAAVTVTV
jgi:hypothetical protein